jgi:hypothetical protein
LHTTSDEKLFYIKIDLLEISYSNSTAYGRLDKKWIRQIQNRNRTFFRFKIWEKKRKKYPRRTTLLGAPAVTYGIYILHTCLCSSLSHFPSLFLLLLLLIYYIELLQRATPATFTAPTATMATDGHNVLRPPPTPPASSTTSGLLHHVRPPPPRPASATTSSLLHHLRPPPPTPATSINSGLPHLLRAPPPPAYSSSSYTDAMTSGASAIILHLLYLLHRRRDDNH